MKKIKSKKKPAAYGLGGGIQGAGTLAASGSAFGPAGTAIGAGVGLVTGWLSEDEDKKRLEAANKEVMAYQKKVADQNSIYNQPGGYNQYTPGQQGMFSAKKGGKVPSAELLDMSSNGMKNGGGVKLIKGGGAKGKTVSADAGDFVIPNPAVKEFIQDTGEKPTAVATNNSKGNTKIIAGEEDKPELLVKKGKKEELESEGVSLMSYAPNSDKNIQGHRLFGGPGTKSNPDILKEMNLNEPDMSPEEVALAKTNYGYDDKAHSYGPKWTGQNNTGITQSSVDLLRKKTIPMEGYTAPVEGSLYSGAPMMNAQNPTVAPTVPSIESLSTYRQPEPEQSTIPVPLDNTNPLLAKTNKTSTTPGVEDRFSTAAILKKSDKILNYEQLANAGIGLNNLLQPTPNMAAPSLYTPQLISGDANRERQRQQFNADVDKAGATERNFREQSGIGINKDIMARTNDARLKNEGLLAQDKFNEEVQNTSITNQANLYNMGTMNNYHQAKFNYQNQVKHEKASYLSQTLKNVGSIEKERLQRVYELRPEALEAANRDYDSFKELRGVGVQREEFYKMTPEQRKLLLEKTQKAYNG